MCNPRGIERCLLLFCEIPAPFFGVASGGSPRANIAVVRPGFPGVLTRLAQVKNTDEAQFGEHAWTFRHPDFHVDRRDALENIKRKVPAARKSLPNSAPSSSLRSLSAGSPGPPTGDMESLQAQTSTLASHTSALQSQTSALQSQTNTLQSQTATLHAQSNALQTMSTSLQNSVSALQQQIASLQAQNEALRAQVGSSEERVRGLERSYRDVLGEMVNFQKNMAQQDGLMQSLIQYFLGTEGGESVAS